MGHITSMACWGRGCFTHLIQLCGKMCFTRVSSWRILNSISSFETELSLCSLGWPLTYSGPPASGSWVLNYWHSPPHCLHSIPTRKCHGRLLGIRTIHQLKTYSRCTEKTAEGHGKIFKLGSICGRGSWPHPKSVHASWKSHLQSQNNQPCPAPSDKNLLSLV